LSEIKPKTYLEIGSAVWYSSIVTANKIKERNWQVFSFEISHPAYIEGLQNISKFNLNNITFYPFNFQKINLNRFFSWNLDFVFIDWQKSQYGDYLEKIWPLIENNPVIVIDDVIKYHNKLFSLYEFIEKKQINYKILKLDDDDGIMVLKK
jgi:predicted O-methyltransferase YrrM